MLQDGSLPDMPDTGARMRASFAAGATMDPTQEGRAQQLSQQTGIGVDLVRSNPDEVAHRARIADLEGRQLELTNPILARQLTDPNFAAIAHDQLDNLSTGEKIFNWAKRNTPFAYVPTSGTDAALSFSLSPVASDIVSQYEAGHLQFERGLLGNKAQEGKATPEDFARIKDINQRLQKIGPQQTVLGGVSNLAGTMAPQGPVVLGMGAAGGLLGGAAGLLGGPLAPATVPAGIGEGFSAGATAAMGERAYSMSAGNAYLDMLDKGISRDTAKWAAGGVGLINGALQIGGAKLVGALPGVKSLTGAATDAISRAAGTEIADAMTQPTVSRAVKSAVGRFLVSSGEGGGLMAGQELTNQIAQNLAEWKDLGKFDAETPEGRAAIGQRIGEAFVNGALTIGTLHAATGVLGMQADLARASRAQQAAQFFTDLSNNAAESKVRERNPGAYEAYIAAQAKDSPAENVYVDGQKFADVLHQSGIDPEQLERKIPGITGQINEAAATGGDVAMPTAQYAARLAGTDLGNALLPHMRLDPDAMSSEEATRFFQSQKEQFAETRATAEREMTESQAFAKSAKAVESDIFDQLKATKTMPDDMARTNAQFVRDFVVTQAARSNMMPEEFFDRYRYNILSADRGGGVLHQGGGEGSPEAPEPGSAGGVESSDADVLNQSGKGGGNLRRRMAFNKAVAKIQGEILKGPGGKAAEESGAPDEAVTKRGGFDPASLTTLLGQKADMSTFLHETGHYFLSVYADMAKQKDAPAEVKSDMDALLKWFGVKDLDEWHGMDLEAQRKHHEQFAYSFEKYLAEGRAPRPELQGIFDRFASWLKRVYVSVRDDVNTIYRKQHGEDLPLMTGEVRSVMDRMLASDEQIREAEELRNMHPLFRTAEEAKMTPDEWAAYRQMSGEASDEASSALSRASIRQMQWLSNARSKVLGELQRRHDAIRNGVRDEVAREVAEEPAYAAQRFLKNGELRGEDGEEIEALAGHKLDADRVKAMFPESAPGEKPSLAKLRGMTTTEGGLDPDIVAPMFGFDNGEQLVRSIADARDMKEEVDARTDQRMLERHGELVTPEQREAVVERALHNEARQRFVAVELRALTKATEPVRVMQKAAELTAEGILAKKPIGDIQPREFAAAEARAAREAVDALKRGDSAGAAKAKRNQLLQNALTKAALKAREQTDESLNYLKKFDKPSLAVTKAIGADYMDRINELMAGYQLSARAKYYDSREALGAWVQSEYGRTGIMPVVSDDLIAAMGTMHWKDMTARQLADLRDAVKSLEYIGRGRTTLEIDGRREQVDDLIREVITNLADVKHTAPVDIRNDLAHAKGLDKINAQWLMLKSGIRSADAGLLKMEQFMQWLDAGKDAGTKEAAVNGPMQRLFHLASNAEGKERAMRAASTAALRALGEKLRDEKIDLNEPLDVPELPLPAGMKWYRENLLAAALNLGNESNKEKLLAGYYWQERDVVAAINRLLSPAEMDFVQGVWDHVGSYGQGIVDLQRRQTGVTPKMIEPASVSTAHGTYHGGYYPIVYDSFLDRTIEERQAKQADQLFENNYARPATNKGHTIERTNYTGPIWLSLGVIARHIDQVTHDLAWREAITDMNKVLTDPRLRDEVEQTYGREYAKQFRPWLQAMANDRVFNTAGDSFWEGAIRKARSNATMVGIGFRLSTMAVHGTSALSNSIGEVGAKWFAKGVQQFMGPDRILATRDFIYARSPEMANRLNEADRNVHEAIDEVNRHQAGFVSPTAAVRLYDGARKFAFRGVMALDLASAMPTWMGAYLKAMAKEEDGGLNLSEADAVEYANRAVRNAHGGGGVKDMSAVQRDKGMMSLATMFYSYWSHVYNRQRDLGKGWGQMVTGKGAVRDFPRLLARSWFYVVIPQLAHVLLTPKPGEDDGKLSSFLERTAEDIALGFVSGVPLVRDIAAAAVHGRDYAFTPIEQIGKSVVGTVQDAMKLAHGEEPSKHAFQRAAETAGYALGLPIAQPAATVKFLWDVMDGEADPETLKDWWTGVMTGRIR